MTMFRTIRQHIWATPRYSEEELQRIRKESDEELRMIKHLMAKAGIHLPEHHDE